MTKDEFLKRCEAQWDSQDWMKTLDENVFLVMRMAIEYVNRAQWQQNRQASELWLEIEKLSSWRQLAWFTELYSALSFAYRLAHPCSECAKDPSSWETRYWFCDHKSK